MEHTFSTQPALEQVDCDDNKTEPRRGVSEIINRSSTLPVLQVPCNSLT